MISGGRCVTFVRIHSTHFSIPQFFSSISKTNMQSSWKKPWLELCKHGEIYIPTFINTLNDNKRRNELKCSLPYALNFSILVKAMIQFNLSLCVDVKVFSQTKRQTDGQIEQCSSTTVVACYWKQQTMCIWCGLI